MNNIISLLLISTFSLFSCNSRSYLDDKLKESRDLVKNNKIEKAIKLLDQLEYEYPDNIDIILDRGTFKSMMGRYQESLNDYQKVAAIDKNNTLAYYNMGLSYSALSKHRDAIESFDKAINTKGGELAWKDSGMGSFNSPYDVPMVEIRYDRGMSRNEIGELKDAFDDFSFCISNFYLLEECYILRGYIYLRYGKKEEACDDFIEARKNGNIDQADSLISIYGCE